MTNKFLFFLVLISFSIFSFAQENEVNAFINHDVKPSFPGGEKEMQKFIYDRVVYTDAARKAQAEGRVTLRFRISKTGGVENAIVLRGIHPDCDSIALDIVKSMPKWNPGTQNDVPVEVYFTLPIFFKLPEDDNVHHSCDTFPSFPGGTDSLYTFLGKNLKYPENGSCFQGRVIIRFIVTKEGKIKDAEVYRSLIPEVDKEALRVVSLMPDFVPGKINGKNVNAYYILPITFKTE